MWWSGHAESYARSEATGALEGLERLAGQRNRAAPARWARARDLDEPFVEMENCGLYADSFYERHGEYVRWSDDPEVAWVRGFSLRDNRSILVPEQLVYYLDWRADQRNSVQECSNGCASGSTVTEAVMHGLLELLERDAFLLSWYSGLPLTSIDLTSVESPAVAQMSANVSQLGYDLRCFDIRFDVRVPAVGAVAIRRDRRLGYLCFAGGSSLDPASAVCAAVREVASYVPGFEHRVRSRLDRVHLMARDFRNVEFLEDHALLYGLPAMAEHARHWVGETTPQAMSDVFGSWNTEHPASADLRDEVEFLVAQVAKLGYDTIAVDQTMAEQRQIGIRTVCVVVPGLVPIDFGWERQRLLTMPRTYLARQHGQVNAPRSYQSLNLSPHPFP
jgi:ribosomal protein S12 methylthiotransferase accessory factor